MLRSVARLPPGSLCPRHKRPQRRISQQLEAAHPQSNEKMVFNLSTAARNASWGTCVCPARAARRRRVRAPDRLREHRQPAPGAWIVTGAVARGAYGPRSDAPDRQTALTESVLLAAIGGVAGVLLGVWTIDGLLSLAPESMPRLNEVRLEPGVLAFASLVTLVHWV